MSHAAIHEHFPFANYRKGQREAIEAARAAFKAGKRFVIIEAPTGAGKSAIAITLARQAASAYVLTAQKILQQQYVDDFPEVSMMKGRSNYPCLIAPTHAAAAPCITGFKAPECSECPYFSTKDAAMAADNTIMNYAYYLAELNYSGGFGPRELLVLDEAHNAEASLMSFIEVVVSDSALTRVGILERLPKRASNDHLFDFADDLISLVKERSKELENALKSNTVPSTIALEHMQHKQWCDNQFFKLRQLSFSRESDEVEWVVEQRQTRDGMTAVFKPVSVAPFAEPYLFGFAEQVLMLSATILDADTYLRSLGINPSEAEVITIDSDFPTENRPIYLKPVAKLTRQHIEQDLPKLTTEIAAIMQSHKNQKGIIHAHSYKIAGSIMKNLPKDCKARILTHFNASEREAVLEKHQRSLSPTVLLSPSMTEGVNLVEDLSRFQVICKIPYPFLGDPQIARRKDIDPDWYQWRTALTVVQAYGRSVRSVDDTAVTYILDKDFARFLKWQSKRLPNWFTSAIQ